MQPEMLLQLMPLLVTRRWMLMCAVDGFNPCCHNPPLLFSRPEACHPAALVFVHPAAAQSRKMLQPLQHRQAAPA